MVITLHILGSGTWGECERRIELVEQNLMGVNVQDRISTVFRTLLAFSMVLRVPDIRFSYEITTNSSIATAIDIV